MPRKETIDRLWKKQLQLQVKITSKQDLTFFSRLPNWKKAVQVADFGCGSGDFLKLIASKYGDKKYIAVDQNPALLSAAKNNLRDVDLRTVCSDIQSLQLEPALLDYAIARLVLQHVPDLNGFFSKTSPAIKSGGHLLVMDAEDSLLRWSPRLPVVEGTLRGLSQLQSQSGGGRNSWDKIEKAARQHGFTKVFSRKFPYRSSRQKKNFHDMFANLGTLLQHSFQLSFDEKEYRKELRLWLRNLRSSAQFGMRAVLFRLDS